MNPLMNKLLAPPERVKEVAEFLVELEEHVGAMPNGGALSRHLGWAAEAIWAYHFPSGDQALQSVANDAHNAES